MEEARPRAHHGRSRRRPQRIATWSQGGAQFGCDVAWTVLIAYPLMVGIQLASARIGRITGKGLTENFSRFCRRGLVLGWVALLIVAILLFGLGVIGTSLLAPPVLAGSAAYAVASLLHVRKGLDQPPSGAKALYAILAAAMIVGPGISASGLNPIKALYWSGVVNAVISVPVMVAAMIAASRSKIVGDLKLPVTRRVPGWLATVAMAPRRQ